jgi:hypothetical protein
VTVSSLTDRSEAARMEMVWSAALFVLGVIAQWLGDKLLDYLLKRWTTRRQPLTDAQVRRYHRRRFTAAAVLCAWFVLLLTFELAAASRPPQLGELVLIAATIAATVYMARVARRRWRRLRP